MNRKIVVGVWKDKLTVTQSALNSQALAEQLRGRTLGFDACVAPSPIALVSAMSAAENSPLQIVCQDVHWQDPKRSYIGTTSIPMLKDVGINICIVGHSERRRVFGETDEDVHRKLLDCIDAGIFPILAVGDEEESLEERRKVLQTQLKGGLGLDTDRPVDISKIAIAYEPVWAISTWRSNSPLPTGKDVSLQSNDIRIKHDRISIFGHSQK